jgi:hypothetical protein
MSDTTDASKVDAAVAKYIKLRDFKAEKKREMQDNIDKITAVMDAIEAELMGFLNRTGQESGNTKEGTFFKRTTTKATVSDRDVFINFVVSTGSTHFLEARANATAVAEYVAEHETLPPGVSVTRETAISVTRPKTR